MESLARSSILSLFFFFGSLLFAKQAPNIGYQKIGYQKEEHAGTTQTTDKKVQKGFNRNFLERSVKTKRKNFLESDKEAAAYYTELGIECYEKGDLTEAFYYLLRASAIYEEKFKKEAAALFLPYCYLALIYGAFKDQKKAQVYQQRARKIFERHPPATIASLAPNQRGSEWTPTLLHEQLKKVIENRQLPRPPKGYPCKKKKKWEKGFYLMALLYSASVTCFFFSFYQMVQEKKQGESTFSFLVCVAFIFSWASGSALHGWKEVDGMALTPMSIRLPTTHQKNRPFSFFYLVVEPLCWFLYPYDGSSYPLQSIESMVIKNRYQNSIDEINLQGIPHKRHRPLPYLTLTINLDDTKKKSVYEFTYQHSPDLELSDDFLFLLYELLLFHTPLTFSYTDYRSEIEDFYGKNLERYTVDPLHQGGYTEIKEPGSF